MLLRVSLTLVALAALATGAMADLVTLAEWSGIWNVTRNVIDCPTGNILNTFAEVDTLCTGEVMVTPGTCTESADANAIDISCTSTDPFGANCWMVTQWEQHWARSGDNVIWYNQMTQHLEGAGCPYPYEFCERFEGTATRVAAQPDEYCQTPVATVTWGTIKSMYH